MTVYAIFLKFTFQSAKKLIPETEEGCRLLPTLLLGVFDPYMLTNNTISQ